MNGTVFKAILVSGMFGQVQQIQGLAYARGYAPMLSSPDSNGMYTLVIMGRCSALDDPYSHEYEGRILSEFLQSIDSLRQCSGGTLHYTHVTYGDVNSNPINPMGFGDRVTVIPGIDPTR